MIKAKFVDSSNTGLFHDSRGDVRRLAQVSNLLIDKVTSIVNELTEYTSKLGAQVKDITVYLEEVQRRDDSAK